MKTLKHQLFETLINKGLIAHYELSEDYLLFDDSIYIGDIDIQIGCGYVTIWNKKGDAMEMLLDKPFNKNTFNAIVEYITKINLK